MLIIELRRIVLSRLFLIVVLLHTSHMNPHYQLVRAFKLTEEGIEINPSPENSNRNCEIEKVAQVSHHQGNSKHGVCMDAVYQ